MCRTTMTGTAIVTNIAGMMIVATVATVATMIAAADTGTIASDCQTDFPMRR